MGDDKRILINPSILNANFDDLEKEISKVSAVSDAIHLDIMDDKFVPNFTFDLERAIEIINFCLLYTSPSPRDRQKSRMPSSA